MLRVDVRDIEPITAELGAALLDSQRLEYSISYLIFLTTGKFFNDDNIDEFMSNLSKKTLGALIKELGKDGRTNDKFLDNLQPALEARNYIVHKFLNDRSEALFTKEGRNESVKILKEKRKAIVESIEYLNLFTDAAMRLKGYDVEKMNQKIYNDFESDHK